jgi:metal-sulfur cluster biosynthetic enzyme
MVTEEQVREALKVVRDPEIGLDIVNLGLVYDVAIQEDKVYVKMTLTSPACPVGPQMLEQAKQVIELMEGVAMADVEMVWNPPWNPEMMSDDARDHLGIY